jgi:hypothetical protein
MEAYAYKNLSASGLVKTGNGRIKGIIVNSHTGGTVKLWDAVTAAVPVICNTITLGAAERFVPLYDIEFTVGLYVTIGGTADITIVYK